jgi:hypothetical protein
MANMELDPLLKKTIHAAVVNDHVLSGEVAAQVCASLGLSSTNATLGRKFVSLALTSQDSEGNGLANFTEEASQYGTLSGSVLQGIYHKVFYYYYYYF